MTWNGKVDSTSERYVNVVFGVDACDQILDVECHLFAWICISRAMCRSSAIIDVHDHRHWTNRCCKMHSIKLKCPHLKVVRLYSSYGQIKPCRVDDLLFPCRSLGYRCIQWHSASGIMSTTLYTPGLETVSWPRSIHDKREPVADETTRT